MHSQIVGAIEPFAFKAIRQHRRALRLLIPARHLTGRLLYHVVTALAIGAK